MKRGLAVTCVSAAVALAGAASASAAPAEAPPAPADAPPPAIGSASSGRLVVEVAGLPKGTRPVGTLTGPGLSRRLTGRRLTIRKARPGRYVVRLRRARVARRWRAVDRGATAFPARKRFQARVRRGRRTVLRAEYGTVVNPRVSRAPGGLRTVIGDPADPRQLVYRDRKGLPRRGAILTAAPSRLLPYGLVARVTKSERRGKLRVLSVRSVPLGAAVPEFEFDGRLALEPAPGAPTATPAAAGCDGPKTFDVGATLDEFTLRHASADSWPPHMAFTVAVRTTERIGTKLAVAGVACDWRVAELGPWHGAIPTPVGPIPVYATIPVDASASVEGSLSAFRLNVASTSVMDVRLGYRPRFDLRQEGTNVWVDGVMRFSGSATAAAKLALRLGVGSPKFGDLHVQAGFGPKLTWQAGVGCRLDLALGSLSAGARIWKLKAGTPSWSPLSIELWRGCDKGSSRSVAPAISFDGSPGAGPPPATLGPYAMQPFGPDPQDVGELVTSVSGPTGPVRFGSPVTHSLVGDGWATWSHDYFGDVYSTRGSEIVMSMPPATGAVYFYAEPNVFDVFTVTATSQDGTTSGPVPIEGDSRARYFGFYGTCGALVDSVRVVTEEAADGLAVGELGIAPVTGGASPCPD